MAIKVEVGVKSAIGTGTGDVTFTLNDSSLTPIAVILFCTGRDIDSSTENANLSIGFGTRRGGTTQQGAHSMLTLNSAGVIESLRYRRDDKIIATLFSSGGVPTIDCLATLSSFSAGSFVVNVDDSASATMCIGYIVFGGADFTDAIVLNPTLSSTGATQSITGAGFQGTAAFFLDSDTAASATGADGGEWSFGFAAKDQSNAIRFASVAMTVSDGDSMASTMNDNRAIRSDACLERLTVNADTSDARWDVDSFDSDGLTMGVVDAPTNTDRECTILILKGGRWDCGAAAKDTDSGADNFALNDTGLTPKLVMIMHADRDTSAGLSTGEATTDIGCSDGTRSFWGGQTKHEASGVGNGGTKVISDDQMIREHEPGFVGSLQKNGSFSAFNAGSFDLTWDVAGTATFMGWLAVGDEPAATIMPPSTNMIVKDAVHHSMNW